MSSPFVPMPRQKTAWEPLIRENRPAVHTATGTQAQAPTPPPPRPPPPPREDPLKAKEAAMRAEFEAKEAARAKEHAAAMAKLQQLQAEETARLEQLKKLALELEGARKTMLKQLRAGSGQLILEAARKIAGDAMMGQPELIERMVSEATDALGSSGLVLHVAPQQAEHLLETLKDTGILVETDFQMAGGLRAESPLGKVDASLETALVALSRVVEQWQEVID